jgi:hypothetical protein
LPASSETILCYVVDLMVAALPDDLPGLRDKAILLRSEARDVLILSVPPRDKQKICPKKYFFHG